MEQRDIPILDDRFEEDSVTLTSALDIKLMDLESSELGGLSLELKRLLILGWEFSPAIQVVVAQPQDIKGIANDLISAVPERFTVVRMTAPLQADVEALVGELAAEWGVTLTRGRPIDTSVLINRMERGRNGAVGYFLLLENAEQLSDAQWQFLRSLAEADDGLIKVLLLGPDTIQECCNRHLVPFGIECRWIEFDELALVDKQPALAGAAPLLAVNQKPKSRWPKVLLVLLPIMAAAIWWADSQQMFELNSRDDELESLVLPSITLDEVPAVKLVEELSLIPDIPVATVDEQKSVDGAKSAEAESAAVGKIEPPSAVVGAERPDVKVVEELSPSKQVVASAPVEVASATTKVTDDAVLASKDGLRSESWIMAQSPTQYTLHLMSVRKEQSLRELIVDNNWQESAAYYKAHRKSGEWYVLIYGQYSSVDAAQNDKNMIQKKLRLKDAAVKEYAVFQKDIASH